MSKPYVIQSGDTLYSIAYFNQTTVDELLQLNPQYQANPDLIMVGDTLQVPGEDDSSSAEESTGTESGDTKEVIELPVAQSPLSTGEHATNPLPFHECESSTAPLEYTDIAYLVGSRHFYLLGEDGVDFIQHAEETLMSRLSGSKAQVREGLSKSNVFDGLVMANLESFMTEDEKSQYEASYDWLQNADQHAADAIAKGNTSGQGFSAEVSHHQSVMETLEGQALKVAEGQGYSVENGLLYSPREKDITRLVERYFSLMANHATTTQISDVMVETVQLEQAIRKEQAESEQTYPNAYQAAQWQQKLDNLKALKQDADEHQQQCFEVIYQLSLLGIATPEYALCNGVDVATGVTLLEEYYVHLKEAESQRQALSDKLKSYTDGSNLYAPPPSQAFTQDMQTLKKQLEQAKSLRETAEVNVSNMQPVMMLLWEKDDYTKRPLQRLAKGNFPLREYVLATPKSGSNAMRYFSLNDFPHSTSLQQDESLFKPDQATDEAFATMLQCYGVQVPIRDTWFDDKGIFDAPKCIEDLKADGIKVAALEANQSQWQTTLSQVLFASNVEKMLHPYDASLQAQLVRLTNTATAKASVPISIGYERKSDGSTKTSAKLASVDAKTQLDLARGEVNLVQALLGQPYLRFPEKVSPEVKVPVDYFDQTGNKIGQIQFQCGAFQMRFYCKAWGFAAANIGLSGKLALTDKGLEVTSLFKRDETTNTATSEALDFSASVSVGVTVGSMVDWHVPSDLQSYLAALNLTDTQPNSVLTLFEGQVEVKAQWKVACPIVFQYVNKRLRVGIKITQGGVTLGVTGTVAPEAVGFWVLQFQRLLRQTSYHRIQIAQDDETFNQLTRMSQAMLLTHLNVGLFMARGKDVLDDMMDWLTNADAKRAGLMAYSIFDKNTNQTALKQWTQMLVPEALGALLNTLLSEPVELKMFEVATQREVTLNENQTLALQQIAICRLIDWIYGDNMDSKYQFGFTSERTRRQVEEALCRVNASSQADANPDVRLVDIETNYQRLEEFMDRDPVLSTAQVGSLEWSLANELPEAKRGVKASMPINDKKGFYSQLDALSYHVRQRITPEVKQRAQLSQLSNVGMR
ncbi:LysM peptidoglycan-binding domain-containing protein [Vibrio algivorus]|uniref:LysM peptidoglycan-binding domain-containing protein n=1 Tax=Vibrio algivorus TaxID=1667024 RepID=A0A557P5C0_9VIBR|nr:LysM domain-containing protein [Vibrio algivorus]TVO35862.1 LysM peptidoglycan-binding domain-containing protein [Vibrio algivorus]